MTKKLSVIGAPSSAGSYGPGQEKTPDALRSAGLLTYLESSEIKVEDLGNVTGFRWSVDKDNLRAMNINIASKVAKEVSEKVTYATTDSNPALILGGDCTIELGTVAGVLSKTSDIGLIYIDLDTDLNTPKSTTDGALDWMGVAHMLGLENTADALANIGPRTPLLQPEQILFFGADNVKPFERDIIKRGNIAEVPLTEIKSSLTEASEKAVDWSNQFECILIHLDVDVLDYLDIPLAENYRRNTGLTFKQLVEALAILLKDTNWMALTVTEINPDHGESDGSTIKTFTKSLVNILSASKKFSAN
jgi:arginase